MNQAKLVDDVCQLFSLGVFFFCYFRVLRFLCILKIGKDAILICSCLSTSHVSEKHPK